MKKNISLIKIAKNLDLYGYPRSADIFDKKIVTAQQSPPTTQYGNYGNKFMDPGNSAGYGVFTSVNEFLSSPTNLGADALFSGPPAPAPPNQYQWALSTIPKTIITSLTSTPATTGSTGSSGWLGSSGSSGTPSTNTATNKSQFNPDYTCFTSGYQNLPKAQLFRAKFAQLQTIYYGFTKNNDVKNVSADNGYNNPAQAIQQAQNDVSNLLILFNTCLYQKLLGCGAATNIAGAPTCGINGYQDIDSTAPPASMGAIFDALPPCPSNLFDLVKNNSSHINDTTSTAGITNDERSFKNLFDRLNIEYVSALSQQKDNPNKWQVFRYVVNSMGAIANKLAAFQSNLTTVTSTSGTATAPNCTAQEAAHLYSNWLLKVYGQDLDATGGALPSYVINNKDQVHACADASSACVMTSEPWSSFDFQDFTITPAAKFQI